MSSVSLIIAVVGAVAAAVGSGVLLARAFRAPRTDMFAWSVALIGLLISLGAQALGYLGGFDGAMFRAMEIGGQVIAPLALVLGLSEVAGRTLAARFCARVYIPAVAIVALVVLTLDQLASVRFTKQWPDPAVFYETPPKWVLMFAIGPVTALIALIALYVAMHRSSQPAWDAVLPAQLAATGAALLLAYPALALLLSYVNFAALPTRHEFTLVCAAATGLTWYSGVRIGRMRLDALHGQAPAPPGRGRRSAGWDDEHRWAGGDDYDDARDMDQTGDIDRYPVGAGQAAYAGGSRYRPGADADTDYGWETSDDRYAARGPAAGEHDGGAFETGDFDLPGGEPGFEDSAGRRDPYGSGGRGDRGGGASRADLFGQIAIYTLLEDRVTEFDQLIERVVGQVRSTEPDTLVFIVHAVPSAPMQRILYEVYRDREAYERHRQQPYVTKFENDRRSYVLATNVIELGLQQAKVSPFPSVSELFGEPGYDTSGFERPDYLRDYGRPPASQGGASGPSW
jgi:quinol monooxygenase YgiN